MKDAISRIRADLPRTVDEPIVRHVEVEGAANLSYAVFAPNQSADEIGLAVIAITIMIVAVFVPVSFMGGIAGQYFKQFGLTVGVAVLCSRCWSRAR